MLINETYDLLKEALESIQEPIIVVSWDSNILYENPSAKELKLKLGKQKYIDLIKSLLGIESIKNRSVVKGIFKDVGYYKFLIDAYPFRDEGLF